MLDVIANSDGIKAMQKEFKLLDEERGKKAQCAELLLSKFDELFEEAQHCRQSKVVVRQIPLAPEKIINILTKSSNTNSSWTNKDASVNDYRDSRGAKRPIKKLYYPTTDPSTRKRHKKRDRTCSRRKRSAKPTTRQGR